MEERPLSLTCKVTGLPRPEVTWYKNGKELVSTPNIKIVYDEDTCSLLVKKTTMEHEAEYKCVARNAAGQAEISAKVTVEGIVMHFDFLFFSMIRNVIS